MAVKMKAKVQAAAPRKGRTSSGTSSREMLRITLVRSTIGRPPRQREVVKGLGLRKLRTQVLRPDRPEVWGMIRKVSHLVEVEVVESK